MTTKQKKSLKEAIETGIPMGQAMVNNGYSKMTAKTPQKLTESKGAKQWLMENFPDEMLAKVALEGLQATKLHGTDNDFVEIPDHDNRHKFWKDIMAARGKLGESSGNIGQQVNIMVDGSGYIPKDNQLGLKPTKLDYIKRKPKLQ